jgi:hypothetical protein
MPAEIRRLIPTLQGLLPAIRIVQHLRSEETRSRISIQNPSLKILNTVDMCTRCPNGYYSYTSAKTSYSPISTTNGMIPMSPNVAVALYHTHAADTPGYAK